MLRHLVQVRDYQTPVAGVYAGFRGTGENSATVTPKGYAHGDCLAGPSSRPGTWRARVRPGVPGAGRTMRIKPGRSYPLGATHDGSGTNFSLFSGAARRVGLGGIAP